MPILFQILGVLALVVVGLGALLMSFDRPTKAKASTTTHAVLALIVNPKAAGGTADPFSFFTRRSSEHTFSETTAACKSIQRSRRRSAVL